MIFDGEPLKTSFARLTRDEIFDLDDRLHVDHDEIRAELEKHSATFEQFVADAGERKTYSAASVLAFLGY